MSRRYFLSIFAGLAIFIKVGAKVKCPNCNGSSTLNTKCGTCKGSGSVGQFKCSTCSGKGFVKCGRCGGSGQV